MEDNKNTLNEEALRGVNGGFFDEDEVAPGNWYLQLGSEIAAVDDPCSQDYFYCKSKVGGNQFLFAMYTHVWSNRAHSDTWMYIKDMTLVGHGFSKTYVSSDAVKI